MPKASAGTGPNGAPGSQTLARGLAALQLVASSPGRHDRTAGRRRHRSAPDDRVSPALHARAVSVRRQGRRRPVPVRRQRLPCSARPSTTMSVSSSLPTLRALADELGTTVSLLIAEGDQQVAIAVIVPTNVFYQLSFHEGSRYPLERGAAGIALLASMPPRPGERDLVPQTAQAGLGDHSRRDRAEHLRPGRTGPPASAVSADVHQSHLPPRGRGHARQRRSHQGGQRIIRDPRLRIRQPKGMSNGDRLGQ